MEERTQIQAERKQSRGFILGSLSIGHGISHLYDQGFPILLPAITNSMALSTIQVASLLGIRQAGFGIVNLGGGPLVDMLKRHWGLILTGCILLAAVAYAAVGASPNFTYLILAMTLVSIPGALWHLPAAAALAQRFPDKKGFAISIHGLGSNVGNVLGPIMAGALLGIFLWRNVLFIYAVPALALAVFVWWSLRDLSKERGPEERRDLGVRLHDTLALVKNPIVLGLILAATLRSVGLMALFNWTPFYLEDVENGLGMGHLEAGVNYAFLTGMGIASAPVLGVLSDRLGRKMVLVPGMAIAAALSMGVVSAGDSYLLILLLAGMGLFSFALHNIIQAALLDNVARGTEATATGLLFGINGIVGGASPFLASQIIDHLGGFGSIFYYSGILTGVSAFVLMIVPLRAKSTVLQTEA